MKIACFIGGSLLVLFSGGARADFVILDVPGSQGTYPRGISGGVVAGTTQFSSPTSWTNQGFLYQNGKYSLVSVPGSTSTSIFAMDGSTVAGTYVDSSNVLHGFFSNGQTFTTVDYPGAKSTVVMGISGSTVVGYYDTTHYPSGFIYDGKQFTTFNYPGAYATILTGISGKSILGSYSTSTSDGNFLYQNGKFGDASLPGLPSSEIMGFNGNLSVGFYVPPSGWSAGFISDGKTITTFTPPLGYPQSNLYPYAIDASGAVVGDYLEIGKGFLYTPASIASTPEPSSLTLLTVGALGIAGYRWRSRRSCGDA